MAFLSHLMAAVVTLTFILFLPVIFDILVKVVTILLVIHGYDFIEKFNRKYIFNWTVSSKDRAVLITGCDTGFGNFLAQRLDILGYHVFAGCLFPEEKGAKDLRSKTSTKLQIFQIDVTSDKSVCAALDFVKTNLAGGEELWAIVNNAGIAQAGELEWASLKQLQRVYDINTMGVVRVTKTFIPMLRESKGRIVNVTSICGRYCYPGLVGYCMSKSAAVCFTTGLRIELAKWGIKAISIEPYFYKTQMTNVKSILKLLQDTWDKTPCEVKSAYGEDYLNVTKKRCITILNSGSPKVYQVVDCLVDAVTSKEPLSTYFPCYLPYKILLVIGSILPSSFLEFLIGVFMPHLPKPISPVR